MGSGGSFVALLLSVPLTAVALVGVVGVPKLQEMLSPASSHGDDEFGEDGFTPRARSKRGSSKLGRDSDPEAAPWDEVGGLEDEADEFGGKPKSARSRSSLARGNKSKPADDSFGSDLDEEPDDFFKNPPRSRFGQSPKEPEAIEPMVATEPFKSRPSVTTAEHTTPAPSQARPDGFAAGVEKLRAMGVDRFHLEPGLEAGQYLFVCQVEAAGEAGTIHRFEAEAADPAAAVTEVTRQLSDWQAESSVTKTAGVEFRR
ncbi:hypothetical protein Pan44_26030 [Caulifigura coniformis]|uniref:Uncharacterized protein n=1 Tax=Caulifigura coniformis TaxID=2527983 RepID=A0A517SEL4_9PLAN|nr:hypothetical protein [Caulifigura coniformis]QDT54570.1 hypothetical protein Pan44_26030 [Caulifigura coniformis]